MANGKNKLDDFQIDDLSFDDIDAGDNRRHGGDDRKAIQRMATSFAGGAARAFVRPEQIRKLAANALPKGYGTAFNTGHEVYRGAASLYNVAAAELRPALPIIRRATNRMLPKVKSHLPKKFADKLEEFIKGDQNKFQPTTQEQMDENQIASDMAEIFRTQMEASAEQHAVDTAERRLREEISDRRERVMAQRVMSIRNNLDRMVSYQDQVTARFQQKSLELGYRQYFATRDILRLQVANSQRDGAFMESLLKAVLMSEQEKLSLHHRATGSFKDRLIAGVQSTAGSYISNFNRNLLKNLQASVRGAASSVTGGLMGAEQMRDGLQMVGEMDETGEETARFMGGQAAEALVQVFGSAMMAPIRRRWSKKGKVAQVGGKLENVLNSMPERLNKWAKTDDGDMSLKADFKRFLKQLIPRMGVDSHIGGSPLMSADQPATFDQLTRRSITEVIPGFLSRIHHEIAQMRQPGQKIERLTYNLDRGEFTGMSRTAADIKRRIFDPGQVQHARSKLNELVDAIDKDKSLSPETRMAFMRQLMTDSMSGEGFDPERYYSAGSDTRELSGAQKDELEAVLKKRFNTLSGGGVDQVELSQTAGDFRKLKNVFGNPKTALSVYNDAGQKELLKSLKLAVGGTTSRMNFDEILDIYTKHEIEGGSGPTDPNNPGRSFGQALGDAILNRLGAAGSTAGSFIRTAGNSAMAMGRGVFTNAQQVTGNAFDRIYDLYVKGRGQPALLAARLKMGEYRDQLTLEPIRSWSDIKGPVIDRFNNVVLEASDFAEGLRDAQGRSWDSVAQSVRARFEALQEARQRQDALATGSSGSAPAVVTTQLSEEQQAAQVELAKLGTQQVELLGMIYEVLSTRNFAEGVVAGPARKSWGRETLGKIGGLGRRGWGAAKWLGKKYMSYLGFLGKGVRGVVGAATSIVTGRIGQATSMAVAALAGVKDIYVTGEKSPVLKAWKLRKGHYVDVNTKKKIKKIKDISGPVFDLESNEEALSQEQFDKGLYVMGMNGLTRFALKGIGGFAKAVVGGYFNLAKLPFMAVSFGVRSLATGLNKMFTDCVDVYVPTDLKKPRLRAVLMKEGKYYNARGGTIIRGFKDIKGAVKEVTSLGGIATAGDREVISEEEFVKGLCDSRGRPLQTGASRLLGTLGAVGHGVVKAAGAVVRGYARAIGGAFSLAGNLLGGTLKGIGRFFNPKFGTAAMPATERTFNVLVAIHDMLDARLPGKALRKGSWEDQMKSRATKAAEKAERLAKTGGGAMGSFFSWMKDKLFGGGEDEGEEGDEGEDDGDTTIIAGGGGGEGNRRDSKGRKRGGFRRNMSARWKNSKRWLGRSKLGRLAGAGMGKVGNFFGRFKPRGMGVGGIAAGIAAGAGGDWLVNKLGGNKTTAGRVAGTGLKVGGAAITTYSLASMLGLTSGLGAVGSGIAGAAGAVGSGLAAAGAGLLALVGAPVLIGAAALALAGAAVYGGYKYYQHRKTAPLRKLRMAQYGVDVTNIDRLSKVEKLEAELMDHIVYGKDGAKIDTSKVDLEKIHKAMGNDGGWFGPNDEEKERQARFASWFQGRFKPVFLTHLTALHNIDPKAELDDVDDDLKPEMKLRFLTAVRSTNANYNDGVSPFEDGPMVTGTGAIDAAFAEAKAAAEKEIGGKKKQVPPMDAAKAAAAAGATAAAVKAGAKQPGAAPQTMGGKPAQAGAGKAAAAAAMGGIGRSIKADAGPRGMPMGSAVSALQAIRYRAYGLTDLPPDKVQTLAMLEAAVFPDIGFDSNQTATFNGDAEKLYVDFATRFGFDSFSGQTQANFFGKRFWVGWFEHRFLPALLTYAGAVKRNNANAALNNPEQSLKPEQLVDVATAVIAAKRSLMGINLSIWSYANSPWPDYKLNTDSASTYVSLLALKAKIKKQVVSEPTVDGKKAAVQKEKSQMDAMVGSANKGSFSQRLGQWMGNAATTIRDTSARAWNATKSAVSSAATAVKGAASDFAAGVSAGLGLGPVGSSVTHPGNGTGGSINDLPMPTGGKGWAAVKDVILGAAKMAGVSPALMATIASIESGFRPAVSAGTSSATGLYQFIKSTWDGMLKKYGPKYGISPDTPPTDARANALLGAEFLKENTSILKKYLKRDPTDTELYAAHFMGPDTAGKMLATDPNANAVMLYPSQARANKPIFYDKNGSPRTVAQVVAELDRRVQGHRIDLNTGNKAPNHVASSIPATGASGLATTTTANGAQGGLGPKMAGVMPAPVSVNLPSGGTGAANEPSFVKLPNYGTTPVPSMDRSSSLQLAASVGTEAGDVLLAQQRKAAAASAASAQVLGQQAQAETAKQSAQVVSLLGQQLLVQRAMDDKLGRVLTVLSGISEKASAPSPSGTVAASEKAQPPVVRGARPLEAAPQSPPISVKRVGA